MATPTKTTVRLAALGDLHYSRTSQGSLQKLFTRVTEQADVLLLCGDLTDYGLEEEATALARDLSSVKIPILAVLGNHDVESDNTDVVRSILRDAGVNVLDGEGCVVHGVGFAGVKGFCGGFGRRALEPWGEPIIKSFVREALDEAIKLERALGRLRTEQRIVLLHYAPIVETVQGEPVEIFPFLGSTRLEEPLNRYGCTAVFHGHVHHGSLEGQTSTGIPVYNVAMPLLKRKFPDKPPFKLLEIPVTKKAPAPEPSDHGRPPEILG